jgi:hypothetical protein
LASLRRFWALAASRNSSFAPHGPRRRNRLRPRMHLRWAKSISTFFRNLIDTTYCLILAPLVHVNMRAPRAWPGSACRGQNQRYGKVMRGRSFNCLAMAPSLLENARISRFHAASIVSVAGLYFHLIRVATGTVGRRVELCLNLGDAPHQTTRLMVSLIASTPSLNLIPSMLFGN